MNHLTLVTDPVDAFINGFPLRYGNDYGATYEATVIGRSRLIIRNCVSGLMISDVIVGELRARAFYVDMVKKARGR